MTGTASTRALGAGLIALALYFNLPYAILSVTFSYPAILREPPEVILDTFHRGGATLVLTWYGFALAAILFIPATLAHALAWRRLEEYPLLSVSAAVLGALAGLTQAMGLLRWVMVVPALAPTAEGAAALALIHAYAGVAIGEHLGMLLTAAHVAALAMLQAREGRGGLSLMGAATAVAIILGAMEGVALSLGRSGEVFGFAAIGGYLLLTVWLIWSGLTLWRRA